MKTLNLTIISLFILLISCNSPQNKKDEMTNEVFNKKVVIILSKELDDKSSKIDIQDYIENGKSFIPLFTSVDKFNKSTGGQLKKPTIEIDGMFFLSLLHGNEELRINPSLDDELIISADVLKKKYEKEIREVTSKIQQLK